jgi:Co/Zn/Cd efflux system component
MSIALAARSVVLVSYLIALAGNGRFDTAAGVVAVLVAVVWAVPLLRDHHRPRSLAAPASGLE